MNDNLNLNNIDKIHDQKTEECFMKIHGGAKVLKEYDFFPEHEKRHRTKGYTDVHNKMIVKENLGCYICGVNHQILSDEKKASDKQKNPFAAKQMELHHYYIEWALTNAIDQDKFNTKLRVELAKKHPDCDLYKSSMSIEQIRDWIDHHEHNMMPLCDVHHRHKFYGIHEVSYSNWNCNGLYTNDFITEIQKTIG